MAESQSVVLAAPGVTRPLLHNLHIAPFSLTQEVIFGAGATATDAKVQYTLDAPLEGESEATFVARAVWWDHATLTTLTARAVGSSIAPVRYSRLSCTDLTGGSLTYRATQAGIRGN